MFISKLYKVVVSAVKLYERIFIKFITGDLIIDFLFLLKNYLYKIVLNTLMPLVIWKALISSSLELV